MSIYVNFNAYGTCKVKLNNNATCTCTCSFEGMTTVSHDYIENTFVGYNYDIDMASVIPIDCHEYIHARYNKKLHTWEHITDGMRKIVDIIEIIDVIDINFDI